MQAVTNGWFKVSVTKPQANVGSTDLIPEFYAFYMN